MDGVTILATEQVVSNSAFNWWAFVIAFVAIALFSLLLGYLYDILEEVLLYVMFGVFGVIGGVIGGLAFSIPTAYETQYKVTVASDVSMSEFYEHYEVVEQEGLIFTVKEKTDE